MYLVGAALQYPLLFIIFSEEFFSKMQSILIIETSAAKFLYNSIIGIVSKFKGIPKIFLEKGDIESIIGCLEDLQRLLFVKEEVKNDDLPRTGSAGGGVSLIPNRLGQKILNILTVDKDIFTIVQGVQHSVSIESAAEAFEFIHGIEHKVEVSEKLRQKLYHACAMTLFAICKSNEDIKKQFMDHYESLFPLLENPGK